MNDFIVCLGYKGDVIKDYFINFQTQHNDFSINTSEQKYKLQKLSDTEIAKYPSKIKENSFNKFALKYYFFKLIVNDFISYHSKKITN